MAYLKEFEERLSQDDFSRFLHLWEEYVNGDAVDPVEFKNILQAIKESDLRRTFGPYAETGLELWSKIEDFDQAFEVLRLLVDLQTTNNPVIGELAVKVLNQRHGEHPHFRKWLRIVGLRSLDQFQYAISNCELLAHMKKGNFVYHTGGWGTGEIMDVSMVTEQVTVEFENVQRRRDLSFDNAFKTLLPLKDDHFLSLRFGNPDALEEEAKKKPQETIRLLLRDLGPRTAAELKEDLCGWVIPEEEWTRWWQNARARLKRDTLINTPSSIKEPFRVHEEAVSHEDRMHQEIGIASEIGEVIVTTYNYVRDFPNMLKKEEVKNSVREKLQNILKDPELQKHHELQVALLSERSLGEKIEGHLSKEIISSVDDYIALIEATEILSFKKQALILIRKHVEGWEKLFLEMIFKLQQSTLRDYIFQQLNKGEMASQLRGVLEELLRHPMRHPNGFVWYFQKVVGGEHVPFSDKEGQWKFLDSFLVLYSGIEFEPHYRDLLKKMYHILSGKRFEMIRNVIQGTSLDYIKEFLLLVSKCRSLSEHDISILRSLAEVVHPSMANREEKRDDFILWTTEKGLLEAQKRAEQIGTVEIVDNAREIEAARALGDLRENSEYKSALQRRSQLQGELKALSDQLQRARVITEQDITPNEVGVGTIVDLKDSEGKSITYSILGPWDASPENNILSFQSKLAQAMIGSKEGESFSFKDNHYEVVSIKSYL